MVAQPPKCNFYDQIFVSHVDIASMEKVALADSCERIDYA